MDPRISRWAQTLVNYCLEAQPGQQVLIVATPVAEPLVAEVYREVLRAGAHPIARIELPRLSEIRLKEGNDAQLDWVDPSLKLLTEQVDARLFIESETNTRRLAGVDPKRQAMAGTRRARDSRDHQPALARRHAALVPHALADRRLRAGRRYVARRLPGVRLRGVLPQQP